MLRPRTVIPVASLAAVASLLFAAPASAFYWAGWPGSKTERPSIISEQEQKEHRKPPEPVDSVDPFDPGHPTDPKAVPEPGTIAIAALAIASVAAWKKRRRMGRG